MSSMEQLEKALKLEHQGFKPVAEYLETTEDTLRKRGGNPEIPINTIPSLNSKLWGLNKGWVYVIGARTSNGKSAFAAQLAWDCAVNRKRVLFLSLEMKVDRILERLFCYIYRINNYELQRGAFAKNVKYQQQWIEFKNLLNDRPIVLSDFIGKNWQDIERAIESLDEKPEVIVIDHIHHITTAKGLTDKQAIDDYLQNFSKMVIRYNMVGILNAQINRVSQNEREGEPEEHNLKGTGKLEEIADVTILLWWPAHRDDKKNKNMYKINIAKNRDGHTGRLELKFEPEYYSFSDFSSEEKEKLAEVVQKKKNKEWLTKEIENE